MSKKTSMDTQLWILLILIGIASGMLSGLVGVGGGLIIVPALIIFLGFSQKMAQGTSLGILLLPVGILGVMEYYKHGYIDIKVALIISVGFLAGGFFGSKIALVLPQDIVKKIFAVFIIIIGIKMLFFDKKITEKAPPASINTSEKKG
ncbi:MAG TPA: sulfite exporter TauE/SafE family protein [Ferruginibacter sp.]|jgi:uncharacterized membrane protein YfcA|nr:sulfite exporter TauE/SafE family protein [Ferruginibacter sp.]